MTRLTDYQIALNEARKVGVKYATGDAELVGECKVLGFLHGMRPKFIFDIAKSKGLSGRKLVLMPDDELMILLKGTGR